MNKETNNNLNEKNGKKGNFRGRHLERARSSKSETKDINIFEKMLRKFFTEKATNIILSLTSLSIVLN